MTLQDIEGYEVRLIGPKNQLAQETRLKGRAGKTDEYLGRVVDGQIETDAEAGFYDVAFRQDADSPWLSHPDIREHRCR
jgi:hypothetical protein